MEVRIINYGGIITNIFLPDKHGTRTDIVLGFDSLASYLDLNPYFGAVIGRYAGILAGGRCPVDGRILQLKRNYQAQHLNGGFFGFDKQLWSVEVLQSDTVAGLKLSYVSRDGEENYPGRLKTAVTYTLNDNNELSVNFEAETDKPTPVNLTNYIYFNLGGSRAGDVFHHNLMINAGKYLPINDSLVPSGGIETVAGSPFDFRVAKTIGSGITRLGEGYYHYYPLNKKQGMYDFCAAVSDASTGITLTLYSTAPGLQFYTGNTLNGVLQGKGGVLYRKYAGFVLAPQNAPDAPNRPGFGQTILRPGQKYFQHTVYRFSISG